VGVDDASMLEAPAKGMNINNHIGDTNFTACKRKQIEIEPTMKLVNLLLYIGIMASE
jgi:hypothetical protein